MALCFTKGGTGAGERSAKVMKGDGGKKKCRMSFCFRAFSSTLDRRRIVLGRYLQHPCSPIQTMFSSATIPHPSHFILRRAAGTFRSTTGSRPSPLCCRSTLPPFASCSRLRSRVFLFPVWYTIGGITRRRTARTRFLGSIVGSDCYAPPY